MSKPKMLVVYYSWSYGNTEKVANRLATACGADIARIETITPYTGSHEAVVEQGLQEVKQGYKPSIKSLSVNIADYDVIAIGTPTWWYTMAPAVLTFISQNDFAGKTVIPFMTNAGWAGHVIKDMKALCKGASFSSEKEIQYSADEAQRDKMITSEAEIAGWIQKTAKGALQ